MEKWRIDLWEINNISEPIGKGGKAEVVRAYCERNRTGAGCVGDVAVKKVECDNHSTRKEKVSKVRILLSETLFP